MNDYANRNALVSTAWVEDHLDDARVVVVEVNADPELYDQTHIPGAAGWSWRSQLSDTIRRDVLSKPALERLLSDAGIAAGSTVVLCGDQGNWFAAWAFWQLAMYGHRDTRMMDGGRRKWELEGRALTSRATQRARSTYRAAEPDRSIRAFLPEILHHMGDATCDLLDVRSVAEFTGELLAPPGLPESCQRGGHIPGAVNIPWSLTLNEHDGSFLPASELRALYARHGVTGERPVTTYCRIGERSSHTWFVLRHLLGFTHVKNYDGSWTEWGNLVGVPVGRGL